MGVELGWGWDGGRGRESAGRGLQVSENSWHVTMPSDVNHTCVAVYRRIRPLGLFSDTISAMTIPITLFCRIGDLRHVRPTLVNHMTAHNQQRNLRSVSFAVP